jgi:hypothetical protein
MTASGTYGFALQADDCLTEAWECCGKSPSILTGEVARSARRSLQLMMLHWTNLGVPLWQVEQTVATLTQGTVSITLSAEIADVLDAYTTDSGGNDRIMGRISRSDYVAISNKTIQAPPSQIWVQRVLPNVSVTFYPVPDQTYTFTAWCLRQPQDISAIYQTPEAPALWAAALCAGLAYRLAIKFAPDRLAVLKAEADSTFAAARLENRERTPLTLLPSMW